MLTDSNDDDRQHTRMSTTEDPVAPTWWAHATEEHPTGPHFRVRYDVHELDTDGVWIPSYGGTMFLPLKRADGRFWDVGAKWEWCDCVQAEKTIILSITRVD